MELTDFAKRILFSCRMEEKLCAPGTLTDMQPFHPENLPVRPGRPPALNLDRWKNAAKVSFPSRAELLDPEKIGVLLHFFANHELLALELMALALLKFPDAPPAFRMGVARTMLDEQRHLCSYLSQMREFGVELGDIPVNDFFWSQCASMKTPIDYVARMSLTFEQANLDFAAYFRDVLRDLGQHRTADLLQTVLDDEIGHVKHGLVWFRRWKSESQSDWQAFCEALGGEINAARAKGSVFREEFRLMAGFDQDYIDELKVYSQSKGGLPRLAFYNPEAEEEVRRKGQQVELTSAITLARDDLAPVMIYALSQDDVLLLPRELPRDFLLRLRECGFTLPELMCSSVDAVTLKNRLGQRKLQSVHPWAMTPKVARIAEHLSRSLAELPFSDLNLFRTIYSKSFALAVLNDFLQKHSHDSRLVSSAAAGQVVSNPQEFERCMQTFVAAGYTGKLIAKRPWSAAGRHRLVECISTQAWDEQPEVLRRWFEKSWRTGEIPIVQPYFERLLDASVQGRIDRNGDKYQVHVLGFTRILNLPNGQYAGSVVGRFLAGSDQQILRFWHTDLDAQSGSVEKVLEQAAVFVGEALARQGYAGSFGVDTFLFRNKQGEPSVFPIVEINPRHTMGRVALSLGRRIAPGRTGLWLHVNSAWFERLGVTSFVELRARWEQLLPLKTHSKSGGTLILSGMLETTPAELCSQVWTCFVVGTDLGELIKTLDVRELV
jgi:uncharacterized ferritin-like protein (DUF455 family)